MVLAKLLIAGGGAQAFAPPSSLVITTAPQGGWTQIPESRAIWFNDVTYITYVNGSNGNVEVITWTPGGGASSAFVLHAALDTDTHACPALLVRPDGHIVAAYSAHNGSSMFVRVSSNPEDITAWGSEITAESGGDHTYPILIQRLAETNDPLYLFYRNGQGTSGNLAYVKSSDGGATWGSQTVVWDSDDSAYWKITSDGQWRIDFAVTDANPQEASSSVYHFYADDEDYKTSDGTPMTGQPFGPADATLVYDSSDGPAWPHDLVLDTDPRILYGIELGGDTSYRYATWNGAAWDHTTLLASGGAGQEVPTYGCLVDDYAFLTRFVLGIFEIYRYALDGSGGSAITHGSAVDQMYPTPVHNHPSGEMGVVWVYGDSDIVGGTFDVDFDLGIKGYNV